MRVEQQPAFVLHARPYRETSLLLDVFTRDFGRVGIVARGARGERSRLQRGALQALQPLHLGWVQRGELGTLASAEAVGMPLLPAPEMLYATLYLNELVVRLCGRNDPHERAFTAYADCLAALAAGHDAAWTLRRFERDFLAALGYGLVLERTAAGGPVEADREYGYDPEDGPVAVRADGMRIAGAALLALARDGRPEADHLEQLRRLVRHVVRHLVGGELNAWRMVRPASRR